MADLLPDERTPAAIYLTTDQLRVGDHLVREGTLKAIEPHHDGRYFNLTFPRESQLDKCFSTPATSLWLVRPGHHHTEGGQQ